jgi:Outer membrane protein beta-barrel domain
MKTKIALTTALVFMLGMTHSQTILPKVGGSLSFLSASDDFVGSTTDLKPILGLVVGVGAEFNLNESFSVQPEILFAQRGWKAKYTEGPITEKQTNRLNFLEVPIVAKYKFGDFYVGAGPSLSYGIGGKSKWDYKNANLPESNESGTNKIKFGKEPDNYSGNDHYLDNAFNVGVLVGAGYRIADMIIMDVRFIFALTNLIDEHNVSPGMTFDNKSRNSSLQVTVAYPISFGNRR